MQEDIPYKLIHEKEDKWICFDLDGVCCRFNEENLMNTFGPIIPEMIECIKILRENGCKISLYSCRPIKQIIAWLQENEFEFDSVNSTEHNPSYAGKIKPVAELYVDDKGFRFNQDDPEGSIKQIYKLLGVKT